MLSYQHAFHAGNLADVQKHALLAWTLAYMVQKDKPVTYIETHAGRPVILKLSPAFQDRHNTATTLARDLWLARDRARPDYAGRPWLLWSANSALVTEAAAEPVEWVVVQK